MLLGARRGLAGCTHLDCHNEATQSHTDTKQRLHYYRPLHLPDDIGESREELHFEHEECVPAEAQDDLLVEIKLVQEQVEVVLRKVNRNVLAFPRTGRQVASARGFTTCDHT